MVSEPRGLEAARRVSGPAGREAGSIWKEKRPSAEAAVARHSLTRRPSGPSAWIMMAASGAARPAMARGRPGLAWSCFAGYKATGTIWPTERSVMVRAGTEGDAEKTTRMFCTAPGGRSAGRGISKEAGWPAESLTEGPSMGAVQSSVRMCRRVSRVAADLETTVRLARDWAPAGHWSAAGRLWPQNVQSRLASFLLVAGSWMTSRPWASFSKTG